MTSGELIDFGYIKREKERKLREMYASAIAIYPTYIDYSRSITKKISH